MQSALHPSISLLVCYQSHTGVQPSDGYTSRVKLHSQTDLLVDAGGSARTPGRRTPIARGCHPLARTVPGDLLAPPGSAGPPARSASDMAAILTERRIADPPDRPGVKGRAPSRHFIRHYCDNRRCFLLLRRMICLSQAGSSAWFRSDVRGWQRQQRAASPLCLPNDACTTRALGPRAPSSAPVAAYKSLESPSG